MAMMFFNFFSSLVFSYLLCSALLDPTPPFSALLHPSLPYLLPYLLIPTLPELNVVTTGVTNSLDFF